MTVGRVALVPLCAALGSACLAAQAAADTPEEMLKRWFDQCHRISATVLQTQRVGFREPMMIQIRVQSDGKGRSRSTILQPLRLQGIETFDDGRISITIHPDKQQPIVRPSPHAYQCATSRRMALIRRNYALRFDDPVQVAGRRATVIVATPREESLPVRRFALDENTALLLRAEQTFRATDFGLVLDTKVVQLASGEASIAIQMPSVDDATVKRDSWPRPFRTGAEARKLLGFEPSIPENLPYGFSIEARHAIGEPDEVVAAIRLSDGFNYVTVYQWTGDRRRRMAPDPQAIDGRGVHFAVRGDLSTTLQRRILEAFVQSQAREAGTRNKSGYGSR